MIALFQELWALFVALWNTGNRWAQLAVGIITLWPFALVLVALIGVGPLTSLLALLPFAGLLLLLLACRTPLVAVAIAAIPAGRSAIQWVLTITGVELAIGVYFSVVSVENDRGLVPLLVLVLLTLFFFAVGVRGRLARTVIGILVIITIVLTAIFILGGREEAKRWVGGRATGIAQPATTPIAGLQRIAVPLRGHRDEDWVQISRFLPGCTRVTFGVGEARNPVVRFSNGKEERLDGREFGMVDPQALKGEGVVYLWLSDIGKGCRTS